MILFLPVQCRMARAALGLGVRELAAAAKVSIDTVARFERGDELKERTIEALQRALEAAGVEFTNGGKPGVRLTRTEETDGASRPTEAGRVARGRSSNASPKKAIKRS
jgi:transcriptional regulator with XRE-family HTH domain